jgi:hypothetical protein
MTRQRTTLIRRAATPAEVHAGRPAWYGSRIESALVGEVTKLCECPNDSCRDGHICGGVAPRCACPETGNDPEALLARWAYEDAIDAAAKEPEE